MGKQHNKVQKRGRRKSYLKRKTESTKAQAALGKKPAKEKVVKKEASVEAAESPKKTAAKKAPAAKKAATKKAPAKKAAAKKAAPSSEE